MNTRVEEILGALPDQPGVYQFFDKDDKIIYIGKAKSLQKRVRSYFSKPIHDSVKTNILVRKIDNIKTILVETEFDALLLENSLIKKYKPRYNILLKDDKTYPWICIKKEPFPRVYSTRKVIRDGSEYFGPYASGKVMATMLDLIRTLYPLRNCSYDLSLENIQKGKLRACLEFQIGNCNAPCEARETEDVYDVYIRESRELLKGNFAHINRSLKEGIKSFAEKLEFEKAQDLKEKLDVLEQFQSKSTVVNPSIHNVDVFTLYSDQVANHAINYMKIVNGAIIQSHTVEVVSKLDEQPEELLWRGIIELRERFQSVSEEIFTSIELDTLIPGVTISVPKIGDKKKLIDLSLNNARYFLMEKRKMDEAKNPERKTERILDTLQRDLRLKEQPVHIECFDNSNFQGTNAVAACVVFKNAKPSKKEYRHFNIKTVEGPNDFASMEEVVYRRYHRMLEEQQSLPQLILIDGGKGQLSAAVDALKKLDLYGKIAIIGIAKKLEELYFPNDSIPLYLDKKSESLKVLQNLRNEAHRFGITHHRNKRSKDYVKSELLNIPGIGPKTMETLLGHFKSVKRIKTAPLNDIIALTNVHTAELLQAYFKEEPQD